MIHPSGKWLQDKTERHPDEIGYPDVHRRIVQGVSVVV
ncbi:hypothetical protein [Streptomyces phage phiScoe3]|nr:hypothetical protein [Streptomyces phage phiScoe3]